MQRKLSIDTLRGLACILLVAFHVIGHNASAGLRLDDNHILRNINDVLALLRMPLFSFLSGFVYAWRPYKGAPFQFVAGKFRRLLVPMFLVGTVFAVLQANTPGSNGGVRDWSMLHIIPVAHYWFLESLFIIFLVTALLDHFKILSNIKTFIVIWILAAIIFVIDPFPIYFGLRGAAYLMPFFLLGLGSNRFQEATNRLAMMFGAAALLLVIGVYLISFHKHFPDSASVTQLLIGACLCLFLINCHFESRWLAWIGVQSFAIYLFHSIFTAASRIGLIKLGVESVLPLFISGLLFGLFGSMSAAMLLRRTPYIGCLVLGESKQKSRKLSTPAVEVN